MKKCLLFILAALLLVSPALAAETPIVSARAALLIEAESGRVLYEKNADEPMLIASTTKILTALLALEHCDMEEEVTIRSEWTGVEGSSMYLKAGERYRVEELLYGLMLASGNDAALALACHTAGSIEAFATLMNEKAAELGCQNAHFVNPNGLDDPEHYASARDLALITREALKNEDFCRIVSSESVTVGELHYRNHNKLLHMYEGVFGVKTGYTKAAGRSLVSCCEKENMTLLCVTIDAPEDWDDHMSLYDWGYARFERRIVTENELSFRVPLVGGLTETATLIPAEEMAFVCPREAEPEFICEAPRFIFAGAEAGKSVGCLRVMLDGREVSVVELVLEDNCPCGEQELSRWERILRTARLMGRNVYSF